MKALDCVVSWIHSVRPPLLCASTVQEVSEEGGQTRNVSFNHIRANKSDFQICGSVYALCRKRVAVRGEVAKLPSVPDKINSAAAAPVHPCKRRHTSKDSCSLLFVEKHEH